MQRTLQLRLGAHVASKTAGRIRGYPLHFPAPRGAAGPSRPRAAFLSAHAARALRVRAVRATVVNKKNVSGCASEHLFTSNNNRI
jgi:hypothetical protein